MIGRVVTIMLRCCSNLLCRVIASCACLSHCDVNLSFPETIIFVDLPCDVYQSPYL